MSFILSGSLHPFRNCRISHANIRLLRFYSGKCLSNQFKIRPLTTRAEVTRKRSQNSTPESIKLHINQTEILKPHIEPIKCYQAPSKERNLKAKIDRPVTILAFDIETTGFNTPAERIVEFAARNLIGGRYSTFQTLIDPQKIIRNSDIHGITNSMIKQAGAPRMEDVIPRLFEWVERQEPDKPVIWLAHNGKTFDFSFLIREMNRCGFDVPDRWRFFDTLTLSRRLVDSNGLVLKKHKVTDLCEFFGIVVEEAAHTAMGDVNRLSYIFQHITIRLKFTISDVIEESLTASDIKWKPSK
ncbi:exonuclease DPD1, chloroplastic/mitochondrial-like [Carex rostrata]